jgi:hypothetical protein
MANSSYSSGLFYGVQSVAPPPFFHPGGVPSNVVQLGVPLDVTHTDGTPMSMHLQLNNVPIINFIQNELQSMARNPNFASIYALGGPPQVIWIFFSLNFQFF